MHDYINKVHLPAVHIHDQLELFWNPSFNKTQNQMEDFKQSCYYAFPRSETPLGILNFIYEHTVKRCSDGLTTETTKLLANFQNLLRQIKERIGISHHQQFDTETEALAVRFASLDTAIAKEVLAKMECQAISAQNPLEEIKNIFSSYMDDDLPNSLCLLQDIIVGKNFNNKAVEELENIIRLDLLQQVFFGGICANITFGGNVDEMEWYQTKIIGLVKHMLNFIPNYLERELAKSFPYIEMNAVRVAIDQLGLTCPVTTIGEMFQVKDKVFTHLAQVGSKRYNQKDEERAQDARKWFERKIEYKSKMISFNNYLYRKLDENFNLDNVSDLVGIIENEMETLLCTPQTYRNMAVLRDYDAQMRCRVKEAAQLSVISELMLGYDYVPYRFDGTFFLKCEEWKLYFFL
uniref:Uncharacterized protein n=1 Tax=Globodera pallida TaxID=36090 RepID=A0A183BMQ0_GLOPA